MASRKYEDTLHLIRQVYLSWGTKSLRVASELFTGPLQCGHNSTYSFKSVSEILALLWKSGLWEISFRPKGVPSIKNTASLMPVTNVNLRLA